MTPDPACKVHRTPVPPGFRLRLAQGVRRPGRGLVVGGTPTRILRLSARGSTLLDRWSDGEPVGDEVAGGLLARRLVDAGIANPVPPGLGSLSQDSIAVAIPVRDDSEGLRQTLKSLYETAHPGKVVVVDDGSDPPLEAALREFIQQQSQKPTVLIRSRHGGPGAARNTAWRYLAEPNVESPVAATPSQASPSGAPEIVVFLDAGVIADPGWLETLLAHFADPTVGAVAPRVRSRSDHATPRRLGIYERHRSPLDLGGHPGYVAPARRVSYVPTAALALRLRCLVDTGGFDETLRYGEDVDLVWRLWDSGWVVRYEPRAEVTHPARQSWRAWLGQRYSYGRSAGPLAHRHGQAVAPLSVSAWSVALWALVSVGRLRLAAAVAVGTPVAFAWRATRPTRRSWPSRTGQGQPSTSGRGTSVSRSHLAIELSRLALIGNLRSAIPLCIALRRAWSAPTVGLAGFTWSMMRPRTRVFVASTASAIVLFPGFADWWKHRSDGAGVATWCALRLLDDLAYQTGVWAGSLESGSLGALLPRLREAKTTRSAASPV